MAKYFQILREKLRGSDGKTLIPFPAVAYYRANRQFRSMPSLGNIFSIRFDRETAYMGTLNAGADYQAICQWFYLRENSELREKLQVRNDPDFEFPDLKAARRAVLRSFARYSRIRN